MGIYDVFGNNGSTFDVESWAAKKQAERQEAYDVIEKSCNELAAGGEPFRQYLEVQGRFDRYSVNNAILVTAQFPEATQLKDWSSWKQSRAYVNRDARKVTILEPGKEYTRNDGSKAVSYNAKTVYDISETSAGRGLKAKAAEPKPIRALLSALIDAGPVPFQPVKELEVPAFYDSGQQVIFVRQGLTEGELFAGMAKEAAAAFFDLKYQEGREASEFKSYCVAYMLCSRYGTDTRGFCFDQIPGELAQMDTQAFKSELSTMRDVLGELQGEMYRSMEKNKPSREKGPER